MFCEKCGNPVQEGQKFCAKCGAMQIQEKTEVSGENEGTMLLNQPAMQQPSFPGEIANIPQGMANMAPKQGGEKKSKLPLIMGLSAGGVLLIIGIVIACIFLFGGKKETENPTENVPYIVETADTGDVESEVIAVADSTVDYSWKQLVPVHEQPKLPIVDIKALTMTPGEKSEGMVWDSSLFYMLEDVSQESSEDGYIAYCNLRKMYFQDINGDLVQFEIYSNPNSGEIYKIVTVRTVETGLELTDYYYSGGMINFIFQRTDSIYTPTYATIDKVGERYYFNNNVMVKWRMIREPGVIGEYVLTSDKKPWYSQANYFTESEELRRIYDETEQKMLSAANNVYWAVMGNTAMGIVEGYVRDTAKNPLADMTVDIFQKADGALLYRAVTGGDGYYRIPVFLDGTEVYIIIHESESYKENVIYGINLVDSCIHYPNNPILYSKVANAYAVCLAAVAADQLTVAADGSLNKPLVHGASVSIRQGQNAREGEAVVTLNADEDGYIRTSLVPGTYTVEIWIAGYGVTYKEIQVGEEELQADCYVLPAVPEGQTAVVMTWDDPSIDLDLTLFTPYQSTGGDMAHVGGDIKDDGYGNRLVSDNAAGCEVLYVNTAVPGSYKVYVNDYTSSMAGNYFSGLFSTINVHIYIYDSNGYVTEYRFPTGQPGIVWEVVELNGTKRIPGNRVYTKMDGKNWWTTDKNSAEAEELRRVLDYPDGELSGVLKDLTNMYLLEAYFEHTENGAYQSKERMNALLNGDFNEIVYFHNGGDEYTVNPMFSDVWFDNSVGDTVKRVNVTEWYETLTGRRGNFAEDSITTNYGGAGTTFLYLINPVVEKKDRAVWKVTFDVLEHHLGTPYDLKQANISFLIKKANQVYYNGFQVVGVDTVHFVEDNSWAKIYADYLTSMGEPFLPHYSLIYFPGCDVPFAFMEGGDEATGAELMYISNGRVNSIYSGKYMCQYWAEKGLIATGGGRYGSYWEELYKYENGDFVLLGSGNYSEGFDDDTDTRDGECWFSWNYQSVSEQEYQKLSNGGYEDPKWTQCDQSKLDYMESNYQEFVELLYRLSGF